MPYYVILIIKQINMSSNKKGKGSNKFVNFKDFDYNCLVVNQLVSETSIDGENTFMRMYVLYKYEGVDISDDRAEQMCIEGPEFVSDTGLVSKYSEKLQKVGNSVFVRFDMTNPDHVLYFEIINKIYERILEVYRSCNAILKKPSISDEAARDKFKNIIYIPVDEKTFQPIIEKSCQYFKCIDYMWDGKPIKTRFAGLDKVPIPWNLVREKKLTFIPCLSIKYAHYASISSITNTMASCVVLDIDESPQGLGKQDKTIDAINNSRQGALDNYKQKLAIMASKQNLSGINQLNPITELPIENPPGSPNSGNLKSVMESGFES